MNPKISKMFAKVGLGLVASAVVGYTIRTERKLDAKIDERYSRKDESEETEEVPS